MKYEGTIVCYFANGEIHSTAYIEGIKGYDIAMSAMRAMAHSKHTCIMETTIR